MAQLTCGFIGLGLIGGSIAKALRNNIPNIFLLAYDVNLDTLTAAAADHTIDLAVQEIDNTFSQCDYLFLCAPVQKNDANLKAVKKILSPHCILTDVGSVKTNIHQHIEAEGLSKQFIGGHPMAGSERFGYLNSKASLLENAYYILTPTPLSPKEKITEYQELVKKMGAIPLILNDKQHDYITAAISHLPHIIASSLVNLIHDSDSEEGIMKMVAAGGFKDITRIASSSAAMWQQICLTNTQNIAKLLNDYIQSLTVIHKQLQQHQEENLYALFERAQIYRDSFSNTSSGPIKVSYSINLDIADEPGTLAAVATILALNQINIKNIGIVHNRESESGVLQIEFYEEAAIYKAKDILSSKGYTLHEKNKP